MRARRTVLWSITTALLLAALGSTALARSGDLDAGFGRNGRALGPVGVPNQPLGYLEGHSWLNNTVGIATVKGGDVVAAGERTVLAFRRDGTVDRHFGSNGRVNLPIVDTGQTIIKDVAVDSSGRILVLAASRFAKGGGLAIVARLSGDGKLDTSFADNGILLTNLGLPAPKPLGPSASPGAPTDLLPTDFAIDGQGRLVIAGTVVVTIAPCRSAGEQPHHAAFVTRLQADGSLDTGFGSNGVVIDGQPPFYYEHHPSMGGIAIRDGAIYYATDKNDSANCEGFGGGLLVRLDEAGGRDPGFGFGGALDITPPEARAIAIAIDRGGRILVMRQASSGETKFGPSFEIVSRRNADGTLDANFGHQGEIAVKLPGEDGGFDAFAVDARGRTLLAGRIARPLTPSQTKRDGFPPPKFVLERLSTAGLPDHSFGKKGRVVTGFGRGSRAAATDIVIHGKKAIVAGPVRSNRISHRRGFAVARYWLKR